MGLSEDGDEAIEQKYEELCYDLNMDSASKLDAWETFQRIRVNYTLEGNGIHWLVCALYVSCRERTLDTVGTGTIQGNCVSLTRLLRSAKLSLIEFFKKMHKWCDMANMPQEFRDRVDRLEKKFAVSTVIYKKFEPIFLEVFKNPANDPPKQPRSRKQRRVPCTPTDVFNLCWTMFSQVKGVFPAIGDDLVNSYHLLLCCVDYFFTNALMGLRSDLLNPDFAGLPENFGSKDFKPPSECPCIINELIERHEGIVIEAIGIKEHWWKPHIDKLFKRGALKGRHENLTGILDIGAFDLNSKSVNGLYEEYVLQGGDFDERVFLGADADVEIGTPAKSSSSASMGSELRVRMVDATLRQHVRDTQSLAPSTPLTGRRYLKEKEAPITPVSTATQSVSKLQTLLSGRKTCPAAPLLSIFTNDCSRNPQEEIEQRVKEMGETFCTKYAQPCGDHPGSQVDFAVRRLQLGESLYYKLLENIMLNEKKRMDGKNAKPDFSNLLEQDIFHRSLFACSLEIVIYSYNHQRTFPWVAEVYNLQPYYMYKVIEVLIRAEDGLSRDVIKHLNHIEEMILDSLAWKSDSPLWDAIKQSNGHIPSVDEVSLPSHLESSGAAPNASSLLQSPLMHPALRRIAGVYGNHRPLPGSSSSLPGASPTGPSVADRFSSPMPGSAKRRLFSAAGDGSGSENNNALTAAPTPPPGTKVMQVAQMEDGRQVLIPVQVISVDKPAPPAAASSQAAAAAKPKRTGSLALWFRKVYYLASVRLRDLCERLDVDSELRSQIWTGFENTLMQHIDLMQERHLDQLIMCAIYVMCKVTGKDRSFQDIMRCYRLQPQAQSHVYRSVLLSNRRRRGSGNSSGSTSPSNAMDTDKARSEKLSKIRSDSALPHPQPDSCPPTPTRLAGTGTAFEFEDRGDLISFYNTVFVKRVKNFATKFSAQNSKEGTEAPPLSALPAMRTHPLSPRRVSTKHSLYVSPHKLWPPPAMTPRSKLLYCFNKSPAQDLRAINRMIQINNNKQISGKRISLLEDGGGGGGPSKRPRGAEGLECSSALSKKLEGIVSERAAKNSGV